MGKTQILTQSGLKFYSQNIKNWTINSKSCYWHGNVFVEFLYKTETPSTFDMLHYMIIECNNFEIFQGLNTKTKRIITIIKLYQM